MPDRLPGAVLFACTANRVRSPMAEGLMRAFYGSQVFVDSCGVAPKEELDPFTAAVKGSRSSFGATPQLSTKTSLP